jgi:DNA-binding SARP family transcriptional activator
MQVRLFGELEAVAEGVPVPVRGAKQRALLALLALQRGRAGRAAPGVRGGGGSRSAPTG